MTTIRKQESFGPVLFLWAQNPATALKANTGTVGFPPLIRQHNWKSLQSAVILHTIRDTLTQHTAFHPSSSDQSFRILLKQHAGRWVSKVQVLWGQCISEPPLSAWRIKTWPLAGFSMTQSTSPSGEPNAEGSNHYQNYHWPFSRQHSFVVALILFLIPTSHDRYFWVMT